MKNKSVTGDAPKSASPIFDPNISIQARFLWILVRQFEEHRPGKPTKGSELTRILGVTEDTLRNYRCELVGHGYLRAESRRDGASRFTPVQYTTIQPASASGYLPPENSLTQFSDSVL